MGNTNIVEQLKNNAVFQLSLSSKELFHSNFLCWLAEDKNCSAVFTEVLKLFGFTNEEATLITDGLRNGKYVALREYKNFDFCICEKKADQKLENSTEDNTDSDSDVYGKIIFVLENKFKSLPYEAQLAEYEEKVLKINKGSAPKKKKKETDVAFKNREDEYKAALNDVQFVLLSLIEDISYLDKGNNKVRNRWLHVTYESYANALGYYFNNANDDFARELIEKYQNFISDFSQYITEELNVDISEKEWGFLSTNKDMKSLRTDDIWQKLVASKIAVYLQSQLQYSAYNNLNVKNIIDDAEVGSVTIGVGFTRGTALIDVKKKISDEMIYGIQIQNGFYKRILETTEDKIKDKNEQGLKQFFGRYIEELNDKFNYNNKSCNWEEENAIIFDKSEIHPKESHIGKTGIEGFGGYGKTFICQSKVILDNTRIKDVVELIKSDITNVSPIS